MIALALLLVVQAPTGASAEPVSASRPDTNATVPSAVPPPPVDAGLPATAVQPSTAPVVIAPPPPVDAGPTAATTQPSVAPVVVAPGPGASPMAAAEQPVPAAAPAGKFVFAWLPSVVMGISDAPSFAPATVFLGGRLPRTWALGYQLTVSFGLAERYLSGLLAHRHHLTALHGFGANRRGLTSVGGGVSFNLPLLPVAEVEARIGFRFGDTRRWAVGALVRLGWDIGHQERAPMPQFGAFFGYVPL